MLETRKSTDVHDLLLERRNAEAFSPFEAYERLKQSSFFDREHGVWKAFEMDFANGTSAYSSDQLLGTIALAAANPKDAAEEYAWACRLFYDMSTRLWHPRVRIPDNVPGLRNTFHTTSQLFGLIAAAIMDPEEAPRRYEQLRTLCCDQTGRWLHTIPRVEDLVQVTPERYAEGELLALIALQQFDPAEARSRLETLRLDPLLYNPTLDRWRRLCVGNVDIMNAGDNDPVTLVLMDIYLEASWNPSLARSRYLRLRQAAYDEENARWSGWTSDMPPPAGDAGPRTRTQLFAFLVESRLAQTEIRDDAAGEIPSILTIN